MEKAAEELNFEYAARLRDRINSIRKITEKQKVIVSDTSRHDCFASVIAGGKICVQVFVFKNGHLADSDHYIFDAPGSAEEFYEEFLPRFYDAREIPKEIIIDVLPVSHEALSCWLSQKSGSNVTFFVPQKGDKKKLCEMCSANAAEHLSHIIERNMKETAALGEIAKLLGLSAPPEYIESYDISNIAGTENVAGMVVFKNGRPYKNAYRKFKIKGFSGQDDYRSMAEVLDRRFTEYEKGEDEAFSTLPDLILLDGGKGQLSAVFPVLKKHNLDIAVFGMVKDSKHRTDGIASTGGNIVIKSNRSAFALITSIQDEVHRFAIGYHKARRSKSMVDSSLTKIPGIGDKKAKALLKQFKTMKKIREASIAELCSVKGVTEKNAKAITEYFQNN